MTSHRGRGYSLVESVKPLFRAGSAPLAAVLRMTVVGARELLLNPSPHAASPATRVLGRPVVDGLAVASHVEPGLGAMAEPDVVTLYAIASLADPGTEASWTLAYEDILDADEQLAELLDPAARLAREDREIARLEAIPVLGEEPPQ
jgi:hypothetical protein